MILLFNFFFSVSMFVSHSGFDFANQHDEVKNVKTRACLPKGKSVFFHVHVCLPNGKPLKTTENARNVGEHVGRHVTETAPKAHWWLAAWGICDLALKPSGKRQMQ